MSIIGWLIIGAIAGWLASLITRENADMNWWENILVGIVGALVGGFFYGLLSGHNFTKHFNLGTLLVATIGAVVVLVIYRAVRHRAA